MFRRLASTAGSFPASMLTSLIVGPQPFSPRHHIRKDGSAGSTSPGRPSLCFGTRSPATSRVGGLVSTRHAAHEGRARVGDSSYQASA